MQLKLLKQTAIFILIFGVFLYIVKSYDETNLKSTFFFTIGGLLIYLGYKLNKENDVILTNGVKTKAKVINFIKDQYISNKGHINVYYYPVIRFTDVNQLEVSQQLDISISRKFMNQFISIKYLKKDDGYDIILDKKNELFKIYYAFYLLGALFLFIAFYFYINK